MDPVIVVGAGPVGLTLALALARHGVPCLVLDEGPGPEAQRLARTVVLRSDTAALVERLTGTSLSRAPSRPEEDDAHAFRDPVEAGATRDVSGPTGQDPPGVRLRGWRHLRRKQTQRHTVFAPSGPLGSDASPDLGDTPYGDEAERGVPLAAAGAPAAPLHLPQHGLDEALRRALSQERLVKIVPNSRLDELEQDDTGIRAHTQGRTIWWRGSYLVGCDGPRSTVRKLLDLRFPGRSGVERHAVAALRTEMPWPGEAVLHRAPPWHGAGAEIVARPLPHDVWRLDWLVPAQTELVTPDALVTRVRDTLAGWCEGATPPYELLDTGVYTVHHRVARRWRAGRAFLAGDAAHLLGALGTQGVDEGLRDADNLAWKLATAWHHGASETLLDSYQAERRAAVTGRLRAADQSLPILRGGGGLRSLVPGTSRGHDVLLSDAHLGTGPLGAAPSYHRSPLSPQADDGAIDIGTPPGRLVADVPVTAEDGASVHLHERLGRTAFLVVLVAPGTGVWERRHWMTAGVMPRLAAAVRALPCPAELLVAESYPGAPAHTVLLIRPDGHLVTALGGVRPAELYGAADAARGKAPGTPPRPPRPTVPGTPAPAAGTARTPQQASGPPRRALPPVEHATTGTAGRTATPPGGGSGPGGDG
ncbi:FAD-dependent monooxygenase [Streptomyces sp. NPDC007088]|uniref:FAD-dependent monooxygenase n=1 Tax=Streptomyces sp. NPDC007088 TaxID=3364773 RepID=UPI003678468B